MVVSEAILDDSSVIFILKQGLLNGNLRCSWIFWGGSSPSWIEPCQYRISTVDVNEP